MTRRWWSILLFLALIGADVLIGGSASWWRLTVNLSVVTIIAATITLGLAYGLIFATVAAILFSFTSVLNPTGHTIGYLMVALTVWFISHRVVTSRSTISFLTAIIAATAIYSMSFVGSDAALNAVIHQPVHQPIQVVLFATSIQLLIHPLILISFWRLFGRNRYHRLTATMSQTF